jgi:putative ABC transport system substrate-binding protein
MLAHARNPNTATDVRDALATAASLGRTLHVETVASASDVDPAVAALVQQRVTALFIAPQADFRFWRHQILALAERHALATSFSNSDFVVAGGLMSYGPDQVDSYREAGKYTGRILKGEKPAGLPVLVSTKFDFAIKPQDREVARPDGAADDARACHRRDRMKTEAQNCQTGAKMLICQ